MSPKISFWLLLRLALLLAAFLAQPSEGASFADFQRQHINHPKTRAANDDAYCAAMMQARGLMNGRCKPTNTFIIGPVNAIIKICKKGGTHSGRNLFTSKRSFPVVTCRSTGSFPNCGYRAKAENRKVCVACVKKKPVHFERLA